MLSLSCRVEQVAMVTTPSMFELQKALEILPLKFPKVGDMACSDGRCM